MPTGYQKDIKDEQLNIILRSRTYPERFFERIQRAKKDEVPFFSFAAMVGVVALVVFGLNYLTFFTIAYFSYPRDIFELLLSPAGYHPYILIIDFATFVFAMLFMRDLAEKLKETVHKTSHLLAFEDVTEPRAKEYRWGVREIILKLFWHPLRSRWLERLMQSTKSRWLFLAVFTAGMSAISCILGAAYPIQKLDATVAVYMSFFAIACYLILPLTFFPENNQKGITQIVVYAFEGPEIPYYGFLVAITSLVQATYSSVIPGMTASGMFSDLRTWQVWLVKLEVYIEHFFLFFTLAVAVVTIVATAGSIWILCSKGYLAALDPLEEYRGGGLRSLGSLVERSTWGLVIISILQLSRAFLSPQIVTTGWFLQLSLIAASMVSFNYLLPAFYLHRRTKQLKSRWLTKLQPASKRFLSEQGFIDIFANEEALDVERSSYFQRLTEAIRRSSDRGNHIMIHRINEWPAGLPGFARVVGASLAPYVLSNIPLLATALTRIL